MSVISLNNCCEFLTCFCILLAARATFSAITLRDDSNSLPDAEASTRDIAANTVAVRSSRPSSSSRAMSWLICL
ncbi:hypothetical protein [Teredinibacter franksiae]|uniref:hypothetical protein n=1 Tax=Teredinibacter franksiae TaxID=2761453 RepID=UPI001FE46674|nr:hypothetical protein [Teredinibacter franksiae]